MRQDLCGQRFGKLVVTEYLGGNGCNYLCICDCGGSSKPSAANLRDGESKSCGCMRGQPGCPKRHLVQLGQRFGKLVVVGTLPNRHTSKVYLCVCDCGNQCAAKTGHLRAGSKKSCGCLVKENNLKHGHARHDADDRQVATPTYTSWNSMLNRCVYANHAERKPEYAHVSVCDRWNPKAGGSFENFLADKGERPEGKTLDRFPDKVGNYEPSNTRWATPSQQALNRAIRTTFNHAKASDATRKKMSESHKAVWAFRRAQEQLAQAA